MGDVAMTVPVVASLARQYPDMRITVLSRPFTRCFFENLAPNVGFMEADLKKDYKGLHGLNVLYRRLVSKQFTAVADCHDVLRTKYLRLRFFLGGYKVAHINKHRHGKRLLARKYNKVFVQQPTSFQNYIDVITKLGYSIKPEFTSIYPQDGAQIDDLYGIIGEKKENYKWLGIAPFAAHKGKIYPIERMEKAIQLIIKKFPKLKIFLFGGGKEEKQILDSLAEKYEQCMNASAILGGLENEIRLMSHLDAMISMDSANMHLASLVNTPVISVWGATHPYAGFMGWNQKSENAVQTDMNCRPCSIYGNKPCFRGDYACMNSIAPEQICDKVATILNQ
ncbi:ADP-heptose:LPS heptosyltransferase [Prevotella sp. KH2C16]|nr:ADP-heptose:LPS heptosyltransferase [Prevotella sp. KH2C16]